MEKIKEQGSDTKIFQKSPADARNIQEGVPRVVTPMRKPSYGIKVTTILNATEQLTADLEYLASIVENPDPEFPVVDALVYAEALTALSIQLDFFIEDLAEHTLSEDGEYVKLSEEELLMMSAYNDEAVQALLILEEVCGISLQNN